VKVDLDHDGVHHEKQAQGDGDGDHGRAVDVYRHAIERGRERRRGLAEQNSGTHAECYPQRQIALEKTHRCLQSAVQETYSPARPRRETTSGIAAFS
jgi:hypothetical protein